MEDVGGDGRAKDKEKEKEKKKRRRKRIKRTESRVEQPKPMLTPGGGPTQVTTPRGEKRSKTWLGETPPGSPKEEPVTILSTDFVKRVPCKAGPAYPLPPEPAAPGYIGQYVQSALTGDFKSASHAPTTITHPDPSASKKKGEPQHDLHFRNLMITISLTFSHLRAALLLAFMLLYLATDTTYAEYIWFYKMYSNPTQKLLNILSYLAFSASLCPLAVTLQGTTDPDATESSKGSWFRRLYSPHLHLAFIYGCIITCCVFTAAFDDVLWEYRKQIDSEYKPRMVHVNGRQLAPDRPSQESAIEFSDCEVQTDMERCESLGCCWCEDCADQCTYAASDPQEYVVAADVETAPFSYAKAAEVCSKANAQLCSFAELCTNDPLVMLLVPINDQWNHFAQGCVVRAPPYFNSPRYTVYCCRGCPVKSSELEATTDLEGRARAFKIVNTMRLSLSAVGYLLGLLYQVAALHEREEDEGEEAQPVEQEQKGAQAVSRRRETNQ